MTSPDPQQLVARERELRDREAHDYDRHRAEEPYLRAIEEACTLPELDLRPGHTIVDVGCGTGRHLVALLERAGHVIGVDHSRASLEVARERVPNEDHARLRLVASDVRALPLEDGTADRVLCLEVIQHVPTDGYRRQALSELHRILRPGGILVISAYRWLGHIRRRKEGFFEAGLYRYAFAVREFRSLVAGAGFEDVEISGAGIVPGLAQRIGVSVELQRRLSFTAVGRHLAHYVVARARRAS